MAAEGEEHLPTAPSNQSQLMRPESPEIGAYQSVESFLISRPAEELARRGGVPLYTPQKRVPIEVAHAVVEHGRVHGCAPDLTAADVIGHSLYYREGDTEHEMALVPQVAPLLIPVAWWIGKAVAWTLIEELAEYYFFGEPLSWSDTAQSFGFNAITGGLGGVGRARAIARHDGIAVNDALLLPDVWKVQNAGQAIVEVAPFSANMATGLVEYRLEQAGCLALREEHGFDTVLLTAVEAWAEGCIADSVLEQFEQEFIDTDYVLAAGSAIPDPILPVGLTAVSGGYFTPVVSSSSSVTVKYAVVATEVGTSEIAVEVMNQGRTFVLETISFTTANGEEFNPVEGAVSFSGQQLMALDPGSDRNFVFFLRLRKAAYNLRYGGKGGNGIQIYVGGPENISPMATVSARADGQSVSFYGSYIDWDDDPASQLQLEISGPSTNRTIDLRPHLPQGNPSTQLDFDLPPITLPNGTHTYRIRYSDGLHPRTNGDSQVRVSSTPPQVFMDLSRSSASIGERISGTVTVHDAAGPVPGIELGLQTDLRSPFFDVNGNMVRKMVTDGAGMAAFSYEPRTSGSHFLLAMEPNEHSYDYATLDVAAEPSGWTSEWTWQLLSATDTEATYECQVLIQDHGSNLEVADYVYFEANHGSFDWERNQVLSNGTVRNRYTLTRAEADSGDEVFTLRIPKYGVEIRHVTNLPVGPGEPLPHAFSSALFGSEQNNYSFAVGVSDDGRYIAHTSDKQVTVRRLPDLSVVRTVNPNRDNINSLDFSPDGDYLVTGDNDGRIHVIDIGTGTLFHRDMTDGSTAVANVDWYGGDRIAIATEGSASRNFLPRLVVVSPTFSFAKTFTASGVGSDEHFDRVTCNSSADRCLAAASNGKWAFFSVSGSSTVSTNDHPENTSGVIYALAFNLTGDRLLVSGSDYDGSPWILLYSVSGSTLTPLSTPLTANRDVYDAAFLTHGGESRLALTGDARLEIFDDDGGGALAFVNAPFRNPQESLHLEYMSGNALLAVINNFQQTFYNLSGDEIGPAVSFRAVAPLPYTTTSTYVDGAVEEPAELFKPEFSVAGGTFEPLSLGSSDSFSIPLDNLPVGHTAVSVRARDAYWNLGQGQLIVTRRADSTAPFVSSGRAHPEWGYPGQTFQVLVTVEDFEAGVGSVVYTVRSGDGAVMISGPMTQGEGSSYSSSFSTTAWTYGSYSVSITATDSASPANTVTATGAVQVLIADPRVFWDDFEEGTVGRWSRQVGLAALSLR